jgi:hypothetical protein
VLNSKMLLFPLTWGAAACPSAPRQQPPASKRDRYLASWFAGELKAVWAGRRLTGSDMLNELPAKAFALYEMFPPEIPDGVKDGEPRAISTWE